jgi:hypothetical protein
VQGKKQKFKYCHLSRLLAIFNFFLIIRVVNMRSDIFKNQVMMMKLKKTDIMMMRSGISGVNFENTVIISVIGA